MHTLLPKVQYCLKYKCQHNSLTKNQLSQIKQSETIYSIIPDYKMENKKYYILKFKFKKKNALEWVKFPCNHLKKKENIYHDLTVISTE